jgi:U3 small nucleolar RNA-associated protein 5
MGEIGTSHSSVKIQEDGLADQASLLQRIREVGGGLIPEVLVKRTGQELITSESIEGVSRSRPGRRETVGLTRSHQATPLQRFKESTASNNASRAIMSEEEKNLAQKDLELPVEGDLADLTLGERLAVLEPDHVPAGTKSERRAKRTGVEDGEEDGVEEEDQEEGQKLGPQSTQSLTRLLLQALHTSDPSLLTLILTSPQNSTPGMVRNTIRKLPASMALPLLKACVERLGKGRGFERRGGGRGGGLSGKEGGCVVAWIRGVLVERGSILMTVSPAVSSFFF